MVIKLLVRKLFFNVTMTNHFPRVKLNKTKKSINIKKALKVCCFVKLILHIFYLGDFNFKVSIWVQFTPIIILKN